MTTFDFGFGPVPAHRHKNPDGSEGGWVADTAWVSGNATVSSDATVSGNAWVSGNATVSSDATVSGNARVSGNATVSGGHWAESPPQLQCGRWTACLSAPGIVAVGCQAHTLDEWDAMLDDIAARYNATDYEVALVRAFLVLAADVDAAGIGRQP